MLHSAKPHAPNSHPLHEVVRRMVRRDVLGNMIKRFDNCEGRSLEFGITRPRCFCVGSIPFGAKHVIKHAFMIIMNTYTKKMVPKHKRSVPEYTRLRRCSPSRTLSDEGRQLILC
jgi:hypothetical protein